MILSTLSVRYNYIKIHVTLTHTDGAQYSSLLPLGAQFYHPRMRRDNAFGRVCLSVCLSVLLGLLTFEGLDLES